MGNKLKIEDIIPLNEGQQVKKAIEEKYGCIKNFYDIEKPKGLTIKSIRNYCCSNKINSATFRCLMVNSLDEDWDKIVKDEVNQIKNSVNIIFRDITIYRDESDYIMMEKLRALCVKHRLINENALMLRCLAKSLYYRGHTIKAFCYYNEALNYIKYRDNDIYIIILVELAEHYYYEKDEKEAEKLYSEAQKYIKNSKQVSNIALYKYYNKRGIMLNSMGRYSEARENFERSVQYAGENTESNSDKGAAYIAIGSTYKREGIYEKAKEYYLMSLLEFHMNDINGRALALNNIADIYCILKDYDEAIKHIEAAMKILDKNNLTFKHLVIALTHMEIKLMVEDNSACYEYFDILKKTVNCSIKKKEIIRKIFCIINCIDDIDLLKELYFVIGYLKENTDNQIYANDLLSCMGRICEKINERVSGKFLII